jgi:hypothetical protein
LAQTPDPNHPVNGKPIAFVVVSRTFWRVRRNFVGSSQAMERESLDRCLEIVEIDGKQDPRMVGFVHDQDAGAMKVLRERKWVVDEKLHLNHVNAKFSRLIFNKYNAVVIEVPMPKGGKKVPKGDRWALAQLEGPLRRHIDWGVKMSSSPRNYAPSTRSSAVGGPLRRASGAVMDTSRRGQRSRPRRVSAYRFSRVPPRPRGSAISTTGRRL